MQKNELLMNESQKEIYWVKETDGRIVGSVNAWKDKQMDRWLNGGVTAERVGREVGKEGRTPGVLRSHAFY